MRGVDGVLLVARSYGRVVEFERARVRVVGDRRALVGVAEHVICAQVGDPYVSYPHVVQLVRHLDARRFSDERVSSGVSAFTVVPADSDGIR